MRYCYLSQWLLSMILLIYSQLLMATPLTLNFTPSNAKGGETVTLSASVNAAEIAATQADVYIAVQLPDGAMHYLTALQLEALAARNEVKPLLKNWTILNLPATTLLEFTVPEFIPAGTYKWYITLVKLDADIAEPINWLARISVSFTVSGTRPSAPSFSGIEEDSLDFADFDLASPMADSALSTDAGSALPPSAAPPVSADSSKDDGFVGGDVADADIDPGVPGEPFPEPLPEPDISQPPLQSGTLTAGDIDDNLNFAAFLRYLSRAISNQFLPAVDLSDRVTLNISDAQGQVASHVKVRVSTPNTTTPLLETYASSSGQLQLFPNFDGIQGDTVNIELLPPADSFATPSTANNSTTINLSSLNAERSVALSLPNFNASLPTAVDIMLVIDATGSMGDEMNYLILELQDIVANVQQQHPNVSMRFGLVLYRDEGDFYIVREFPFTRSLHDMQIQLSAQSAGGGGDYPEAMEQGLAAGLQADWQAGNVARLLFLIADAPPHDENLNAMLEQIRIARHMGVRIYPLAASGVADVAEYMMRYAGVLTQGRYLFLTDDSGVGSGHAEPKIACYVVTRLDKAMSRAISSELSGQRVEPDAANIIRQVGNYQNGVCESNEQQQ